MFLVSMFMASAALGGPMSQRPPDYIGVQEQAGEVARLATSAQSCKHFGLEVDVEAILRLPDQVRVFGAREGIPVRLIDQFLLSAMTEEQARLRFLDHQATASDADSVDTIKAKAIENINFWKTRCVALADHPYTGQFIQHTTPDAEAAAYDMVIEQIRLSGVE